MNILRGGVLYLSAAVALFTGSHSDAQEHGDMTPTVIFEYQNPISKGIDVNGLRDCQVFRDGQWWYMTGTSYPHWPKQEGDGALNNGVALYRSKDLNHWEFRKYIVSRPADTQWYHRRFWAPEVHKIDGKWYATFNANNPALGYKDLYSGYAVSDHLEGPYEVVTKQQPLVSGNDLTLFQDDDKKVWAFWNKRLGAGIQYAQIDLKTGEFMTEPKAAIAAGRKDYYYKANGELDMSLRYDGLMEPKIKKFHAWDSIGIEGAHVIKHEDSYYLFYSSWTRGYEIGYATAPSINGPWVKHKGNPFYGAQEKEVAQRRGFEVELDTQNPFKNIGHNQVFTGPDGRFWLSAHGIIEGQPPMLVIDPIWFDEQGNIKTNGPTYTKQKITSH